MADTQNPMGQIPEKQQNIINDTWSQLLGAEGGVQNLAMSLVKSFAASQLGGQGGAGGGGDSMSQLGGMFGGGAGGQDSAAAGQAPAESDTSTTNTASAPADTEQGSGDQPNDQWYEYGKMAGEWVRNAMGGGAGGAAGAAGEVPAGAATASPQTSQTGGQAPGGSGLLDQLGGLGGLGNIAGQFLGGGGGQAASGSGGGGLGNILTAVGGLGGLAALAGNLKDPNSLLNFFMKTPVANAASNPDNSSRDIYKIIKGTIFNLLGSKLPAENFQQNPEAQSAWKGYLGVIANALHKMST
ncbi:hypothetical protein RvY_19195 [Ramazzottius varieornatus]|uniref:Uncharacterized protein n=1 Tax=Ramazzottius varieornatus TaxID=947166 RepID=A0A1D1W8J6_RAMVA|nr:hypothetical protein RvY_19195 [Ramazzottius varieornatus]